jgi:hypothetical protein
LERVSKSREIPLARYGARAYVVTHYWPHRRSSLNTTAVRGAITNSLLPDVPMPSTLARRVA